MVAVLLAVSPKKMSCTTVNALMSATRRNADATPMMIGSIELLPPCPPLAFFGVFFCLKTTPGFSRTRLSRSIICVAV